MKITNVENFILNNLHEIIKQVPMKVVLMDNKKLIEEIIGTSENSFESIMKFFSEPKDSFGSDKNYYGKDKYYKDIETRIITKSIFKILGWDNKWNDVINSFWGNYTYYLAAYANGENSPSFKEIAEDINNIGLAKSISKWQCNLFGLDDNGFLHIAMHNKLGPIGQEKYCEKVLKADNLQNVIIEKYIFSDKDRKDKIIRFASLCHSIANFMPCPVTSEKGKLSYNQLKGSLKDVKDYLPLMINKIQKCIKQNENLRYGNEQEDYISLETLVSWQSWFLGNREKFFLEDYYYISINEEGYEELKGIPLFKRQSLESPFPKNEVEVNDCLSNILRIIYNRAFKISEQLKIQII